MPDVVLCSSATNRIVQASYATGNASNLGSTYDRFGQSWDAGAATKPAAVSGACLRLRKIGSPTGTIRLIAENSTNEEAATPDAEGTAYDVSGISDAIGGTDYYLSLGQTLEVDANALYVAAEYTGGDGSNFIEVVSGTGVGYGGTESRATGVLAAGGVQEISARDTWFQIRQDVSEVTTLVVQAIESRIRDNVADFGGMIDLDRIAWQGIDFEAGESDWLRPTTLFTASSEWLTDGAPRTGQNIVRGILQLSFFSVPGYGYGALDSYVSAGRTMFDRVSIAIADHGDLDFGPAGGPRASFDGAWLSNIVDIPFQIEEHG